MNMSLFQLIIFQSFQRKTRTRDSQNSCMAESGLSLPADGGDSWGRDSFDTRPTATTSSEFKTDPEAGEWQQFTHNMLVWQQL